MDRKIIIVAVAGVALIGAAAVFLLSPRGDREMRSLADEFAFTTGEGEPGPAVPTVPETKAVSEGWRGYENKAFRFGLLYPHELSVREYKEAGGAMSATFEDAKNGKGFQIYVTPYAETQITNERFRLDLSSGVMKEPTDVIIGGVRGTMFWSKNSIMGETREVWLINNGFLYEVVTYKQFDDWLASIMQTWQFI